MTEPRTGDYIAWRTRDGVTVARVTSYPSHWSLTCLDGVREHWDRLPRGWRFATADETDEFERIHNGRTPLVNYY